MMCVIAVQEEGRMATTVAGVVSRVVSVFLETIEPSLGTK